MMKSPPTWFKKMVGVTAFLLTGLLIASFYFYSQLTAPIESRGFSRPSFRDLDEARRKKKLFDDAKAASQRGFVRLSESEINSYLQEQELSALEESDAREGGPQLVRTRLVLGEGTATLYCWVRGYWLGKKVELVWQRTASPQWRDGRLHLELVSMRLGNVGIPPRFWDLVQEGLRAADQQVEPVFQWVQQAPALQITQSQLNQHKELRFYTYPVPGMLLENSP